MVFPAMKRSKLQKFEMTRRYETSIFVSCQRFPPVQNFKERAEVLHFQKSTIGADAVVIRWCRWRRYELCRFQIFGNVQTHRILKKNQVLLTECSCISNFGAEDWQERCTREHWWRSSSEELSLIQKVNVRQCVFVLANVPIQRKWICRPGKHRDSVVTKIHDGFVTIVNVDYENTNTFIQC